MEGFTYVDIYATKGIEYLIVIGFLVAVVMFWRYLWVSPTEALEEGVPEGVVEWFRVPDGYYYHQGHSWLKREGEELVAIGVDDFAQKLVGRADYFWLPEPGTMIHQGEAGWSLNVDSKSVEMLAPVDGEVVEVNAAVVDLPALVNQDPYRAGWLMRVRPTRLSHNITNLLPGTLARNWIEGLVEVLRERVGGGLGPVYHDGGQPVSGIARALAGDRWDEVTSEFFLTKGEL